ncbi:nephrin-like isoform X2 [Planococcus citri]|uniref:nephrin-like isoform X2 n=1 Tax=Planococcus citri TaxID=170843 RepID=UPI0031F83C92
MIQHLSLLCLFISGSFPIIMGDFRPQTFRVKPKDIQTKVGDEIVLPCEVDNRAGEVQWTKDGMALGYERVIPGYPTYSMIGTEGVYNLKIQNVSLRDDAAFECQVGPTLYPNKQPGLRAPVKVDVSSPPSSLEMFNFANNSKVTARAGDELKLQCLARNSKPPAKILWYKGRNELESGHTNEEKNCQKKNGTNAIECDVLSTLTIKIKSNESSLQLSCVVKHEALSSRMFSTAQFVVQYPPETPFIDGYHEGQDVQDGDQINLTCRSSGGNPPAHLRWYRNANKLEAPANTERGRISESSISIVVKPEDNNANYSCEASNPATDAPLSTSVKFSVFFGPADVAISGAGEGKTGDVVSVTCTTTTSNPPAEIAWTVDGHQNTNGVSTYSPGDYGGKITISTLEITIPSQKEEVKISCLGANPKMPKQSQREKHIQVHYPPGQPIISGFVKNGYILSDSKLTLTCTSSGGNPLASLTWYKNNKKFSGGTKTSDNSMASANITFITNKDDNGAVYKCEAVNPTIETPLIATMTLNVYFPPDDVKVSVMPEELHVGTQAKLQCNATVSNPMAEITWWLNGLPLTEGITYSNKPGLHGGQLAFSELILDVTADMNGNTITCQATNAVWGLSKTSHADLNVKYKPKFSESNHTSATLKTEGEFFTVSFEANGNPSDISYEWKKDGHSLNSHRGSTLAIRNVKKSDGGFYTCQATNSEGSSDFISFRLVVKYGASITNISRVVVASNFSDVEMWCTVDGNPIESHHVSWIGPRVVGLLDRMQINFDNNTSILKITKVTHQDTGFYYCVVNNTIGPVINDSVRLILEHSPVTENRPFNYTSKIACDYGKTAHLTCEASGVPELYFSWSKNNDAKEILKSSSKYSVDRNKLDLLNYTSTLTINNVTIKDYGIYTCTIKNKLGSAKVVFELLVKSKPYAPIELKLINTTHNSLTISWALEFDGGEPTSFNIRYYDARDGDSPKYHDADVGNVTTYTITGLQSGVMYIFDVKALNRKGESSYSFVKLNCTTMLAGSKLIVELPVDGEGLILIVAAGIGILLICLNIFIVLVCMWKKSKKVKKGLTDENGRKPSTIEMYGPGSRNSTDLSGRVETTDDQTDVPYIIEDINYPFIENGDYELQRRHSTKDLLSQKLYGNAYEGYSTIGHGHHLKPMAPQYIPYSISSMNFAQSTMPNTGKRKHLHVHHDGYYRDVSPTPTLPPPMSKSLLSEHFLNL